jgi:hypothetical protein
VLAVFVGGIAGMIVGSITDNNGVAITFGLITAVAAIGLILVTMVVPPDAFGGGRPTGGDADDGDRSEARDSRAQQVGVEAAGARIEEQVDILVAAGADEGQVRELVRRAVAFGRQVRA